MESTPDSGEVCKWYVEMRISGTTSDGGSEVVFEVVVSTDKPDYVASQESNTTKYLIV